MRILFVLLFSCVCGFFGCQQQVRRRVIKSCPPVSQQHSVELVVKVIHQHFPKVVTPHLGVKYNYSILGGGKELTITELQFFLPQTHIPPAKYLKTRIVPMLKELGVNSFDCLNINVSRRLSSFVGYKQKLREIKVSFACG